MSTGTPYISIIVLYISVLPTAPLCGQDNRVSGPALLSDLFCIRKEV